MARVAMIGTGYVGLVSGVCFADFGHHVTCIDKNESKIKTLQSGGIPIYEPGLDLILKKNIAENRLDFSVDIEEAVRKADVVFIAVGTPSRRGDGFADLSYVFEAAKEIAHVIEGYTVIVTKSTVPVGTGDEVEKIIKDIRSDAEFSVVSNPEFLREGAAINDFKRPDRVVVGLNEDKPKEIMRELYRPLYLNETPILFTKRRTSELIKYAANAFLATKITFINEIADLCEKVDADIQEVARGVGLDNRIGIKFLNAGPGYGGSCFPKDTLALIQTARQENAPVSIVEAVVKANKNRKKHMADKVIQALNGELTGKKIAVLGLAFKPNTDDMRYAPSLDIIPALQAEGADIHVFDPEAMDEAKQCFQEIVFSQGPYQCIDQSDALVIITEWDQFRALDLNRIKSIMKTPAIIDLRNIYSVAEMKNKGFHYISIGRNG